MTANHQAIGVFDSGVGGLSVLKNLQRQLPNEAFIYLADSAYAPYGQLSETVLQQRGQQIADFFIRKKVKAIVIACNTATAIMAESFRKRLSLPIIALEPAIKPACEQTRNGRIGVFATQNTLNSQRYQALLDTYAANCEVFQSPCLGFVEQVEKGELNSGKTRQLIKANLQPLLAQNIDTLVLGCTHYPFLREAITAVARELVANDLLILDTATAIANRLQYVLQEQRLSHKPLAANLAATQTHYYTSANPSDFQSVFALLMQQPIQLAAVTKQQ